MEKFNETDLMKEIKSCTYEQDYETAVKLAEKLDLNRIKNVSSLCLLGEIFLHEGENDLAEQVLFPMENITLPTTLAELCMSTLVNPKRWN